MHPLLLYNQLRGLGMSEKTAIDYIHWVKAGLSGLVDYSFATFLIRNVVKVEPLSH